MVTKSWQTNLHVGGPQQGGGHFIKIVYDESGKLPQLHTYIHTLSLWLG